MSLSVSVVAPLYNKQECLEEFTRRVRAALESCAPGRYELVFVDDSSFDRTPQLLEAPARCS